MISEHSAHSTPLPDIYEFRTGLWRNTSLLLLILMLWHRQAVFESKWDKLSSSAEYRIRTTVSGTKCPQINQLSYQGWSQTRQILRDLIAATGLAILLKLDLNRWFFSLCDLEIWWMTQKNNRAPLLCYFKLFASFRICYQAASSTVGQMSLAQIHPHILS